VQASHRGAAPNAGRPQPLDKVVVLWEIFAPSESSTGGVSAVSDRPLRPILDEKPADLKAWFPDERAQPAPDLFEIGLVLAGGQSAGCYLAGVLDFLFEALDCWRDALRNDPQHLPNHRVRIKIIVGASAGGLNGALAAICARYRFTPAAQVDFAKGDENLASPFYHAWVRDIDIGDLLKTDDLTQSDKPFSVLNSAYLDAKVKTYVDYGAGVPVRTDRDWLDDPLPLKITLSNLEGVPYKIRFTSGGHSSLWMSLHRDHVAFLRPIANPVPSPAIADHEVLPIQNGVADPGWRRLGDAVLATIAFPFALQQRDIQRPSTDYDYRYVFPSAPGGLVYAEGFPDDDPQQVKFVTIDGGTLNDRPIDLAHAALAGTQGENPRGGDDARRAVVLVDPFPAPTARDADTGAVTLPRFVGKLWRALIDQGRFDPIDMSLAEDDEVYSRFLIAPSRHAGAKEIEGDSALASQRLGSFMGYFSEHYRHHDFMLGRRNCQKFLRDWFVLPSRHGQPAGAGSLGNPLFAGWPQAALADPAYRSQLHADHRQIIPILGNAARPLESPVWPAGTFGGYRDVAAGIDARLKALWPRVRDQILDAAVQSRIGRWFARLALNLYFRFSGRQRLLDILAQAVDGARDEIDRA